MSKHEYLKAINAEIQKLNGVIDHKILAHTNYKREAQRHKVLMRQLRREKRSRSLINVLFFNFLTKA